MLRQWSRHWVFKVSTDEWLLPPGHPAQSTVYKIYLERFISEEHLLAKLEEEAKAFMWNKVLDN